MTSTPHQNSQWVMLLNDECIFQNEQNNKADGTFCKLRHPRTNTGSMFLFSHQNTKVWELTQFKEEFRSWFIDNSVQEDGSFYLTTAVNPVFLVLQYLIEEEKHGKFKPLDQILVDEDFPECQRLCTCEDLQHLHHFCDMKGPEDLRAYKFNKDKTLKCLKSKVEELSKKLEHSNVNVSGGSHSATFVQSGKSEHFKEDCVRFAHGMLSEYLPLALGKDLKEFMGIKDPVIVHDKPKLDEPKSKRAKPDSVTPTDDYSGGKTDNNNSKSAARLTSAQKQLSKVDKSGMKSISSFFAAKTTKK